MIKEKILARFEELGSDGPKRSLGQNFLISEIVIERIIKAAQRYIEDDIIEVGPGLGSLTDELILLGKPLKLIELDQKFAQYWRMRAESESPLKIQVIEGDALRVDWAQLFTPQKSLLVSNLPYQISSSLLIERSLQPYQLSTMILMFQKEVAQRIMAECSSKDYGLLTVVAQNFWSIDLLCECAPRDYYPAPNVASRVLVFKILNDALSISQRPEFLKFIKAAFSHRRKLLYNNLRGQYFSSRNIPESTLSEAFEKLEISAKARAEELNPKIFKELFLSSTAILK